jgi:adenylate cyclase
VRGSRFEPSFVPQELVWTSPSGRGSVSLVSPAVPPSESTEEFWRDFLTGGHSKEHAFRKVLKMIPHSPRCRLCAAPFEGVGGPLMRVMGKRPSDKNPNWCNTCFKFMEKHHGGAEIATTLLFADVRGSTALAESMSAGEFRALMERYYDTAAETVFENDGVVDKFVGDELVAMFFPLLSGDDHAKCGLAAARSLLEATGHADSDGPWVPVGVGLHTGDAWVGAVGEGVHVTITALGDAVNTTARLASAAGAGEILLTTAAAQAAGLESGAERRGLELKGKQEIVEVVALTVTPTLTSSR